MRDSENDVEIGPGGWVLVAGSGAVSLAVLHFFLGYDLFPAAVFSIAIALVVVLLLFRLAAAISKYDDEDEAGQRVRRIVPASSEAGARITGIEGAPAPSVVAKRVISEPTAATPRPSTKVKPLSEVEPAPLIAPPPVAVPAAAASAPAEKPQLVVVDGAKTKPAGKVAARLAAEAAKPAAAEAAVPAPVAALAPKMEPLPKADAAPKAKADPAPKAEPKAKPASKAKWQEKPKADPQPKVAALRADAPAVVAEKPVATPPEKVVEAVAAKLKVDPAPVPKLAEVKPAAVKPAAEPAAKAAKPAGKAAKPAAKPVAKAKPTPAAKPAAKVETKPAAKAEAKPAAKPAAKAAAKPAPKAEAKPAAKPASAAKTSGSTTAAKPTAGAKPAAAKPAPKATKPKAETAPAGLVRLKAPRKGKADDLTQIEGIGPALAKQVNALGFYHFDQIAAWTAADVALVDGELKAFKGRITRDKWVEQAKIIVSEGLEAFRERAKTNNY